MEASDSTERKFAVFSMYGLVLPNDYRLRRFAKPPRRFRRSRLTKSPISLEASSSCSRPIVVRFHQTLGAECA